MSARNKLAWSVMAFFLVCGSAVAQDVGGGMLDQTGQVPARPPAGGRHAGAPDLAAVQRDRANAHQRFATVGDGFGGRLDDEPARRFGIDDDGTIGGHGIGLRQRVRFSQQSTDAWQQSTDARAERQSAYRHRAGVSSWPDRWPVKEASR